MLCIHRLKWKHELCGRGQINISWLHTHSAMHVNNCCSLYVAPAAFASGKRLSYTACLWTHLSAVDSLEMRTFTTCCGMARYAPWLICCLICPRPSLRILASWAVICLHIKRSATTINGFISIIRKPKKSLQINTNNIVGLKEPCCGNVWGVTENNNYNISNIHWNKYMKGHTNMVCLLHGLTHDLVELIQVPSHQCDSRHTNLNLSPWWEPGINNASANRWVSLPPIIFPPSPHLLCSQSINKQIERGRWRQQWQKERRGE